MADELNTPNLENQTPVDAPQLSEVESRAHEQGWVPQDQWTGDPDQWRPAKEFLDRGELFKKIDEQKRELKQLKHAMEEFGKHHAKVREVEFQRALNTLKAQKKAALEDGDHDAVVELDDRIAETKEAAKEAAAEAARPAPQQTEPNEAFVRWQTRNPWYGSNRAMKGAADEIARDMVMKGEQDPMVILAAVDREIRKEFPEKFENPNRQKAGAVEGSTKRSSTREDSSDMSDAERQIMNKILRVTPGLTKEQYLKEFKEYSKRG
jgi:hypothetical protein